MVRAKCTVAPVFPSRDWLPLPPPLPVAAAHTWDCATYTDYSIFYLSAHCTFVLHVMSFTSFLIVLSLVFIIYSKVVAFLMIVFTYYTAPERSGHFWVHVIYDNVVMCGVCTEWAALFGRSILIRSRLVTKVIVFQYNL